MPVRKSVRLYDITTEVILKEGRSLCMRPIRPDDRERLRDLFYRLSPRTRYLRFQFPKEQVTEEELKYYTEVAPPAHYAYVATAGEGERIVAVARWFLLPDEERAEVAFVVEDNVQYRGIGTALLEKLAEAALLYRIKKFVAGVLCENTQMLDVFEESGFRIDRRLEEGVYHITLDLMEQEEFSKRQAFREHAARSAGVRRLLSPRTVAVVGASRDPKSVGGALFRNLLQGEFQGTVFPVNPKAPSVTGVMSYPSVLDVPGDVEMAVIVVPAPLVLDVVEQCGKKGVNGLVIISMGFGEAGEEGRNRERLLKGKVLSYGMRLIGPNCLGVINADPGVRMNATFSPVVSPVPGGISIGSQSGALGLALLDYADKMKLGIRSFVSIGNRVDISSNDLMAYWEDDPETEVIALYLESFGNPRKFSRIARRVSRKKPIIAVKSGKSEVGARAASSHTGALAAADVAVDGMFRQAGVIRVNTILEMFNVVRLLTNQPVPGGPRVGIITNAGGPGVLAADACDGWGLTVPPLSEDTRARLREFLPPEAALSNPVDMIASAPPEAYEKALSIMLDDPDIDSVIFIYIPPLVTRPEDVARAVRGVMSDYRGSKPVLACFMMLQEPSVDLRIDPRRAIPSYVFPEDAVQALALAYKYSQHRGMEEGRVVRFMDIDPDSLRKEVFDKVTPTGEGVWLMPELSAWLLKSYGIPVVETRVAMTPEEASEAAAEAGFPVAMKLRSSTVVHKSDVGGIALGLESPADKGQEMIVGMVQDPVFGPLIMMGLGGTQVEITRDIAFSLHPLTNMDPEKMVGQLKGSRLLTGWRGSPQRDVDALKDVLLRFSALVEDFPEIDQMEINPLVLYEQGRGCAAVDVRIMLRAIPPDSYENLQGR
jgi:acetyl coenzyme A synthetase (ADP forming)-like protein